MELTSTRLIPGANESQAGLFINKEDDVLVLTRKRDERIMIGDDICVTVVELRGDKVRIGIEAPRQIEVHRQEVYERIHGGIGDGSRSAEA